MSPYVSVLILIDGTLKKLPMVPCGWRCDNDDVIVAANSASEVQPLPAIPVGAVIVAYHYPWAKLRQLIDIIAGQVGLIVLIDNSDKKPAVSAAQLARHFGHGPLRCKLVCNPDNPGPAKAFNQGIGYALAQHCRYVLLLDQDSRPAPDMIGTLLRAHQNLSAAGDKVALVGPALFDPRTQRILPVTRYGFFGEKKITPLANSENAAAGENIIAADCLISSGSLIAADTLTEIGPLDERLVIDDVDFEWCFRARARGYRCYAVAAAVLHHQVGDNTRHIPLLDIDLFVHPPRRQYFIMRNHILLLRRAYVPWGWKITSVKDIVLRLFFFALFVRPRTANLAMMLKGIGHGLLGK